MSLVMEVWKVARVWWSWKVDHVTKGSCRKALRVSMVFGYKASLGNLNFVDIYKNTPKLVHLSTLPYLIFLIKDIGWGCNSIVYLHTRSFTNLHSMSRQYSCPFLKSSMWFYIMYAISPIASPPSWQPWKRRLHALFNQDVIEWSWWKDMQCILHVLNERCLSQHVQVNIWQNNVTLLHRHNWPLHTQPP